MSCGDVPLSTYGRTVSGGTWREPKTTAISETWEGCFNHGRKEVMAMFSTLDLTLIETAKLEAMRAEIASLQYKLDEYIIEARAWNAKALKWRKRARKWKRRYRDIHEQNILSTLPREEE